MFLFQRAQRQESGRSLRGRRLIVQFTKTKAGQNQRRDRAIGLNHVGSFILYNLIIKKTYIYRRMIEIVMNEINQDLEIVMIHTIDIDDDVHHLMIEG
jgi:hypothetical protein